ncbi:SHD1 domain-containing protein [Sulfuriroseicoccus oceanibius]|uniref:SLA1 homology domain-containing protein n=1 Tax=Sulfuriroseicoccus oceanibius TaxID=2707525 RepID=A0A6B3L5K5_9BACT|nr:SHD1 domain-containing protein [Sulfuriroseicoccus oceanibius]QQL45304.1 hypothetical protein G3M56_001575 [Sulfuriroseicoccus oceanibius]
MNTGKAVIGALALITIGWAEARTWTDVQGRKLEAELLEVTGEGVVLKLQNGRQANVPFAKLSEADQEFAKSWEAPAKNDAPSGGGVPEGAKLNWNVPWPSEAEVEGDADIEIIEEDKDGRRFVYESPRYRYISDVGLKKSVVSSFAEMFEATCVYCESMPLAMTGATRANGGKFDILLFETKESYIKAGGPPSSAGVYMGAKNTVMVPLESIGVKKFGSSYTRDRDKSSGTLIHELTHQLTPFEYYESGARGWFSEGIAEYTTATPYRNGRFRLTNNIKKVAEYITEFGSDGKAGRRLGEEINAPDLKQFMLMPYSQFTGGNANFNYGFACLLTTYFIHLDGDGDAARLKEFLKALRQGKKGEEALAVLLDGRSFDEMEEDISDGWRRKGIKVSFN